ncbi:Gfo/Idh/MocA family protein [Flammeovirga pacifica]|uniref:Oxidoreductase n=1 Tax=Flammeovirga pacifica TaxID=915059 RepID=A0A1S1YTZ5_FLAPC|nr:Gfo/Idh/MocA family oxidoreductase [Flammeovirga pacifica]OHX64489.1 oxidoreductase [Flammeovirga pacifica]
MKYINNIKWGIIGCGDVTEVKSGPAYQIVEGFELKAVMRRDATKVQDYAKRHGVEKYYTDADQLINDPEIDAIYIATPPDVHLYYALKVAKANKICCIEKPLAPNYQDSLAIYNTFKEKNIPLFVAYYRRSLPRFEKVKTWLDHNEIGEVRHINWKLSSPPSALDVSKEYNWRTDSNIALGGYFDDLASHGIDLLVHFFGKFKEVTGHCTNQQKLYSAYDSITASWLFNNGITGTGYWNFGSQKEEETLEILGSEGTIVLSIFHENPIQLKKGNKIETIEIEHPKHVQLCHVEHMKKHLMEDDFTHPSTPYDAQHVSWVMDKILGKI